MKKLAIWFASLSLLGLCAAGPALAANYAVCVGINNYKSSYCSNPLNGSVPDARHMTNLITARGEWTAADVSFLSDSGATRTKIRQAVSNAAAKAKSGDHFLYYHSSHGGNDNYYFTTNSGKVYLHYDLDANGVKNYICSYDADYTAKQMATDLSAFPAGVKIVVMLDTCHSAGMFKYNTTAKSRKALAARLAEAKAAAEDDGAQDGGDSAEEPAPENSVAGFFMQAVLDQLRQEEADQVRRGLRPRTAASMATDVGWIAAADYDQYSWDGSDGGAFTEAFINGVTNKNKMCDNATYGNQDGYASFYEGWNYAKDIAKGQRDYSAWDYDSDAGYYDYIWTDAQCTNTTVLNNVLVGWAGKDAPSVAPTFPSATATAGGYVGGEVEYTFSASGSSPITYTLSTSVSSSLYDFENGYLLFQPSAAGTYTFTCTAANSIGSATCTLTVTVTEPPPATPEVPATPPAAATTSFTASWSAVSDAASYKLYVQQKVAPAASARAARDSILLSEDFTAFNSSSYSTTLASQTVDSGTWSYESVMMTPGGAANGDGSKGFAQLQANNGKLYLPPVDDPGSLSFTARTSSGSLTLQQQISGEWTTIGSWALTSSGAEYTHVFTNAGSAAALRFLAGGKATYIHDVTVTGSSDTWVDIPGSPFAVSGTSKTVSGLSSDTEYRYSVAAVNAAGVESEPSSYVPVTTAAGDSAPAISVEQTSYSVTVGAPDVDFTVTVTGSPAPTVTATCTEGAYFVFEENEFLFEPATVGTYHFVFTATNSEGSDSETVTIVVSAAPITVPVLTVTNITDTTALATWTACDGVSSYTLQLSTNGFTAASGASRSATPILSEDFAGFTGSGTTDISASLDDHTATPGWTGSKVYCNNGEAKVGASSGQPWLMTPAIAASGTLRVVWTARRYGTGDQGTLLLGVSENGTDFTDEAITLADEMTTYTNEFALAGSTAYVRWMGSGSSKARFYLDDVTVTNPGGGDTPAGDDVQEFTVPGTSYEFTGLTPFTVYYARVKGNADWSNVAEFITEEETTTDTAPSWKATFPATGSVNVGEFYTLANVSSYASGSPAPTITMVGPAGVEAELADDTFTFAAEASGDYTFTFTAANGISPDATATLVVTAVGQAPVLTASQGTAVAAVVGDTVGFTVTATGIPAPTVAMAATEHDAIFENGEFAFAPDAVGTYDFTFTASNTEGTDTLTVTVTVTAAPVTIPELAVTNITDTTALATWTACDGVASYTLQLSTNDFAAASGASRSATPILSEDFSGVSGTSAIADFDSVMQTSGWSGEKVYAATNAVRLGTSSAAGSFQTPALTSIGSTVRVVWSSFRWPNDGETAHVGISVDGGETFTDQSVTLTDDWQIYTNTFEVSASSAIIRWSTVGSSKKRFYIDDIAITTFGGDTPAGDDVQEFTVPGTSYEFTGLTPFTVYYARVKGNSYWSNTEEFITEEEITTDTAPAWSASFPATGTVNVGELYELADIASYASGSPTPVIAFTGPDGVLAEITNGNFQFIPEASGSYTFTFTAANGISPDATATLVVTAVGQAPVLTASQGTAVAAVVGDTVEFTVTATGIPAPTVTMAATEYDALFENGAFIFAPDAVGTYDFTFNASNTEGTDTLTVTVTVTAAPVTIPELAVTNITDTTALATWTACDGVASYTLQLSTNDFAAASGASRSATPILSEDFAGFTGSGTTDIAANNTLDDHTATAGWTGSKVYCNNGEAKVGASSGQPWLMTPALAASGTLRVVWTARRYGTGDQGTLLLGVSENGTDFTDETITLADEMTTYTNEFALTGSTAYVRWMGSGSSKARFYLDDVTITNPGGGDTPAGDDVQEFTVPGTSYEFTGLTPFTVYYARVKGNSYWSNTEEFITEEEITTDTAPAWSASFPATGTVNVGELYELADIASYASGSPTPVIAFTGPDGVLAEITNGNFQFIPEASGDYTFTFTAANGISPDATATLVVTAVGQAPVLTASLGTSVAAVVGDTVEFTVTGSGIPAPTVAMAATEYDAVFENGEFAFAPDAVGTYAFTFTASNTEGTDTLTVTVTVTAAPVTIPELAVTNITDTTALATWTACDGVASYTLQLSTNDFAAASGASRSATPILSEDFAGFTGSGTTDIAANNTLDDHTASAGWTGSKVYCNNGEAKIGASSGQGWLMTPAIAASGTLRVVWTARRYGTGDQATLLLGISENGTDFTDESITLADEMTTYTNEFVLTGSTAYFRWMGSTASKARFYLDDVTITNPGGGDTPASDDVQEFTVPGTSYEFTGLTPFTVYYARVKGNSYWSNTEEFITDDAPIPGTAPAWEDTFPATASVNVGEFYTLANVSSYATGSPAPTITMAGPAGVEAELADDTFTFAAEASGDYTFTFTAANGISPDATATLVVTAVGQAPVLTASQGTAVAAVVGDNVEFTVTATGIPAPTVTMAATGYDAVFENGEFLFAPTAVGTYAFTFTASNTEGTDTLTVTVTVTGGSGALETYVEWLERSGLDTTIPATAIADDGKTYQWHYVTDTIPGSGQEPGIVITDASSGTFTVSGLSEFRYYQLVYTTDLTLPLDSYTAVDLGWGEDVGTELFPVEGDWFGGIRVLLVEP